jgi:hypothetical protein
MGTPFTVATIWGAAIFSACGGGVGVFFSNAEVVEHVRAVIMSRMITVFFIRFLYKKSWGCARRHIPISC